MAKMDKDGCVNWEASGSMGGFWVSMSGNPDCNLCKKSPGEVYKKSHKRDNGITLEASVMYCQSCVDNHSEEVQEDFKNWWAARWKKCEEQAEMNWEKHGIYTNVSSKDGPSKHFGHVKLEDGTFRPYRYEHPENNTDRFERDIDDERSRLVDLNISEKEKFDSFLNYLNEYEPPDDNIAHQLKYQIECVKKYLDGKPL